VLEGAGRTDIEQVVHEAHFVGDRGGRHGVPQSPPGHVVGLRKAREGNRPLVGPRQARQRDVLGAIVEHVLVNLVGNGHEVVVLHQAEQTRQLVPCPNLAARVGRGVDDDRLGVVRHGRLHRRPVECRIGSSEGDVPDGRPRKLQNIPVISVEGLKENHLIPLLQQGEGRGHKTPRRTDAHHHFVGRGDRDIVVRLFFFHDASAQRLDPRVVGIDGMVVGDGLLCPSSDGLWGGEVADALSQIDAPSRFNLLGHGPNVTLLQGLSTLGDREGGRQFHESGVVIRRRFNVRQKKTLPCPGCKPSFRSKSGTPLRVLNVPDRGAEMLVQGPRPPFDQSPFSADAVPDYPGTS